MELERPRYLPDNLDPDQLPDIPDNYWGKIFNRLYGAWGDPHWWPGETAWEVTVGAILAQNTTWKNVEKALLQLKNHSRTTPASILNTTESTLAELIRSSGYYNAKAKKLKLIAGWWIANIESGLYKNWTIDRLREELLNVWGIGPETADSITCYSLGYPTFVVDAYTKRILTRLRNLEAKPGYAEIQNEVLSQLPIDTMTFNHLHGLLVMLGKEHCQARITICKTCPLLDICITGLKKTS